MIKYFDIFAGIGGFRSGLEKAGGFECVGYCEIDRYAKKAYETMYDTEGEVYYDDARKIDPNELPDFDLICGGFPCQSFSIAGKRGGFDDARGTLFFEIARIAAVKKPKYLLLENVPGLLSHDSGRTFATILGALDESKNSCTTHTRTGGLQSVLRRRTEHNAYGNGRRFRRKDRTLRDHRTSDQGQNQVGLSVSIARRQY